jgi:hypothetical protein
VLELNKLRRDITGRKSNHGRTNCRKPANLPATANLTPVQKGLQDLWEAHLQSEFVAHNPEDALATMVEDAYVNDIPVMTGGVGETSRARVLCQILHSADPARYRDDSNFAHDRD